MFAYIAIILKLSCKIMQIKKTNIEIYRKKKQRNFEHPKNHTQKYRQPLAKHWKNSLKPETLPQQPDLSSLRITHAQSHITLKRLNLTLTSTTNNRDHQH